MEGARVEALHLGKPLRWPLVPVGDAPPALYGLSIGAMSRRGKYIWMPLTGDVLQPAQGLLWHLGMSGALRWWPAGRPIEPPGPHDHAILQTGSGELRLTDPRRFGAVVWSSGIDQGPCRQLLSRLGPEPWDASLDTSTFWHTLKRHRTPIKQTLLAGKAVVGVGNIYCSEALFRARIHPATRSDKLTRAQAGRLLDCVRDTLASALDAGGSTLRNYRGADGEPGAFQQIAQVYGREGLPCVACSQPIRTLAQQGRRTYFCGHCQGR